VEVGTGGIELDPDLDARSFEDGRRANTAELQQLRRLDSSSGENDFLLGEDRGGFPSGVGVHLDTSSHHGLLCLVEKNPLGLGLEHDVEVRSCGDWIVVRVTRMGSTTSGLVHGVGIPRRAICLAAVAIDRDVDSSRPPSRPVILHVGELSICDAHSQRSTSINRRVPGDVVGLRDLSRWRLEVGAFDEVGLDALPSPAAIPKRLPRIVVRS
jgi:hypothetical protein